MTRVLHVYKDYYPVLGGIENHLRAVVQELARRGAVEPAVLVTSPGQQTRIERDGPVPVTFAGRWTTRASTPISPALVAEMARDQAEILHLHFPYPVAEAAYLLAGRNRPLVITYHSDVVRQRTILRFYRPILERVLDRADRILATSPTYARSSPFLRGRAHQTEIVPLGIDLGAFRPPAAPADRAPEPTVLFVGRFRYYKGLGYLIDAVARLPGVRLVLGGDGPEAPALRERVRHLALGDRVTFTGDVDEAALIRLYQRAWVFVLPAIERSEAFGTVLIEAMACGVPLITTEIGTGTTYVNQAGSTGLVVPPRDPAALADAIARLVRDAELRARLGAAGRERATAEFGLDRMIDRIEAVYRRIGRSGAAD